MAKRNTNKRSEQQYVGGVKHAAWIAAHRAGVLSFGRVRVGGTMGNRKSKAAADKNACRNRPTSDE